MFPLGFGRHLWDIRAITLLNGDSRVRLTNEYTFFRCVLIGERNFTLIVLSFPLLSSVQKRPFYCYIFASFMLTAPFVMAFMGGSFFRRFSTRPQLVSALPRCLNALVQRLARTSSASGA